MSLPASHGLSWNDGAPGRHRVVKPLLIEFICSLIERGGQKITRDTELGMMEINLYHLLTTIFGAAAFNKLTAVSLASNNIHPRSVAGQYQHSCSNLISQLTCTLNWRAASYCWLHPCCNLHMYVTPATGLHLCSYKVMTTRKTHLRRKPRLTRCLNLECRVHLQYTYYEWWESALELHVCYFIILLVALLLTTSSNIDRIFI